MAISLRTGIALIALIGLCASSLVAPAQAAEPVSQPVAATPLLELSPELQEARAELGTLVEQLFAQGQLTSCAHNALLQLIVDLNARIQYAMLGKTGWKWFDGSTLTQGGQTNVSYDSNYRQATASYRQQSSSANSASDPRFYNSDYHQATRFPPGTSLTIVLTSDGSFVLFGDGYSEDELAALSALANEQGLAALDWAQLFPAQPGLSVEPSPDTP